MNIPIIDLQTAIQARSNSYKQLATSTEQALTQMAGVSLVTDINREKQFYTIIQNLSFVLLLKN